MDAWGDECAATLREQIARLERERRSLTNALTQSDGELRFALREQLAAIAKAERFRTALEAIAHVGETRCVEIARAALDGRGGAE